MNDNERLVRGDDWAINRARLVTNDGLEIDDNPRVSATGPDGDNGHWVAAWVYVRNEDVIEDVLSAIFGATT